MKKWQDLKVSQKKIYQLFIKPNQANELYSTTDKPDTEPSNPKDTQ
jgi:hypothetical protein